MQSLYYNSNFLNVLSANAFATMQVAKLALKKSKMQVPRSRKNDGRQVKKIYEIWKEIIGIA